MIQMAKKKQKRKSRLIKICPKCGSTDWTYRAAGENPLITCNDCNYTGWPMEMTKKSQKKIKEDFKKGKKGFESECKIIPPSWTSGV